MGTTNIEEKIKELEIAFERYKKALKDNSEVEELVKLSMAKGHTNGIWHPVLNISYQVAYQKDAADKNYHRSEALDKEVRKLIYDDLYKYRRKAIQNIKQKLKDAEDVLKKYKKEN